jgi:4-phytase/acid phosphatase
MASNLRTAAGAVVVGLAVACLSGPPGAAAADLKLERVVLLMRHGIRPPTKAAVVPAGIAKDAWPSWSVAFGFLTTHGAEAVGRLGAFDRAFYAERGLLPANGCLTPDVVEIYADTDQRTIKTAEAYAAGLAPNCSLAAGHRPQDAGDPLFSPLDGAADFDGDAARAAVLARFPEGLGPVAARHSAALDILSRAMGCCTAPACLAGAGACDLASLPADVAASGKGKPKLAGSLDYGSTVSEVLLLEYMDGKPMAEVGWGRVSKADIAAALALHPVKFDVLERTPYIAKRAASPLARRMLDALQRPAGAKLTVLVGHDTNIADLGGLLDLHWQVADYPADDPPPAGALGFELLRDTAGHRFVRAVYQAQSMDDARDLTVLDRGHPAAYVEVEIPGCADACPIANFERLLAAKMTATAP